MELSASTLTAGYGKLSVLRDVSLRVRPGQVVAVVGPNGAGKTTLLNTLAGLIRPSSGQIRLGSKDLVGLKPHTIAKEGLALVPAGRHLFPRLTARDNLLIVDSPASSSRRFTLDNCYELFPVLKARSSTLAGQLSGGEQQMLAIGRSLMLCPSFLMLDEPSTGLAPRLVHQVFDTVKLLAEQGLGVLLVEQNAREAFRIAEAGYVLTNGVITYEGDTSEITSARSLKASYLGL